MSNDTILYQNIFCPNWGVVLSVTFLVENQITLKKYKMSLTNVATFFIELHISFKIHDWIAIINHLKFF